MMDYFLVFLKDLKLSLFLNLVILTILIIIDLISLTLQFSKIVEKLFSNRLLSFCDKFNIINDEQFGFRKNISTLNSIFLWSKLNKLSINIDKTHCMSFKNDIIFNINIDNTLLSQVTSTKFLGINLDTCLN